MEISLTKEIGKWVESVNSFTVGKLIGKGLAWIRHYYNVRLDLSMLRAALEHWEFGILLVMFLFQPMQALPYDRGVRSAHVQQ